MTQKFADLDWFPDMRALHYFVAVAEEKSFTRASGRLRIAQPAVSRQVAILEADLGTPLFHRQPRGVELTEAGDILLERCYTVFAALAQGYRDITAYSSSPRGTVIVGMPPAVGEFVLPSLLERMKEQYPAIEMRFVEGFSRELEKALMNGDIALAVMHDPPERSDITKHFLLFENLHLTGPAGSLGAASYSLAEALAFPLLLPSRPNYLRIILDRASADAELAPNIIGQVDGTGHLKVLVKNGHGFTILTSGGVRSEVLAGTLDARPIGDPPLGWQLCIARRFDRRHGIAISIVEETIKAIVSDLVSDGTWS